MWRRSHFFFLLWHAPPPSPFRKSIPSSKSDRAVRTPTLPRKSFLLASLKKSSRETFFLQWGGERSRRFSSSSSSFLGRHGSVLTSYPSPTQKKKSLFTPPPHITFTFLPRLLYRFLERKKETAFEFSQFDLSVSFSYVRAIR